MRLPVTDGWEVAAAPPGGEPGGWVPALVPGTVADAVPAEGRDLDAEDWWFRVRLPAVDGDDLVLHLGGVATVADVYLDGVLVAHGESMFAPYDIAYGGQAELAIRCRALAPLLAMPRTPRARWRTRLAPGGLRWYRTMLLGRMPGVAPWPAAVGPWRPVEIRPGRAPLPAVRAMLDGTSGIVAAAGEIELTGPTGVHRGPSPLAVSDVARWWPHTHGEPALYRVTVDGADAGRIGFRAVDAELPLRVNDVPVFARGAVWTPTRDVRETVRRARDAGFNLLRIPGTAAYESPEFWDACDEYGVLVWQDFMFASFDYPFADETFRATVEAEVRDVLAEVGPRPSLAVLCGGNEVEQQAAMLGLDPALGRDDLVAGLVADEELGVPYVPSAPSGGDLPFRTNTGVAHYFGVGAYRRPLSDARLAAVSFAAECLAFANVGDELGDPPRDAGADWDFADVRDHYLRELYDVEPDVLRAKDSERYADLSRAVSGEVMAEVFGEWRRAGSGCGGGLVLWLRDLAPGNGWGLLDAQGEPKVAYHHLRRALAPVAVWTTDEGLNGVDVHVANDAAEPLDATLRVALYRDRELPVDVATETVAVPPRTTVRRGVEEVLGRFVDASYAYRFGPPGHDLVVVSLERDGLLLAQAVRHPLGRRHDVESADRLGLTATARAVSAGMAVTLATARFVDGARVSAAGYEPDDDAFPVEPGGTRTVLLRGDAPWAGGTVRALNLRGAVAL